MRHAMSFLVALIVSTPAWAAPPVDRELEAAARNFRISTYEAYRTQRPEYNRRIEACNEAIRRYSLANDDLGRVLVRNWFQEANSNGQFLPQVPVIELADSAPSLKTLPNRSLNAARNSTTKDGFSVTKFDSNPRFKPQFPQAQNDDAKHDANFVSEAGDSKSGITEAIKNPGGLFSSIGKSFLRGNKDEPNANADKANQDREPENNFESDNDAADNQFDSETIEAETKFYEDVDDPFAPADSKNEDSKFDLGDSNNASNEASSESMEDGDETNSLDNRVMNFNLTVEMLNEDFSARQTKTIEIAVSAVQQLEAADVTYHENLEGANAAVD